jgi:hypothetical protein
MNIFVDDKLLKIISNADDTFTIQLQGEKITLNKEEITLIITELNKKL